MLKKFENGVVILKTPQMFSIHPMPDKIAFPNSSSLTKVFEKLRFRGKLVWTVGLTKKIKLRFQISPE